MAFAIHGQRQRSTGGGGGRNNTATRRTYHKTLSKAEHP